MTLFFQPDISTDSNFLSAEDSYHCSKVLRLKKNDPIQIVNGKGTLFEAVLSESNPKKSFFEITGIIENFGKRNYFIHIAIAPTKNIDRFEWFLEKTTEIGIDEITPILCEHSERKNVNNERMEKIIIAAIKQSKKAYFPKLNKLIPYKDFLEQNDTLVNMIAHCENGLKENIKSMNVSLKNTTTLIGPEGDFSEKEIILARQKGYHEINLGSFRLRTETAGIIACHTISLLNE
ncbi:MAG: 16S rRNA (uracil(1498)-N(3))-methyltransferase [Bacteroidetes bacterium RIFOXYA12_FULL_35_11]|nr:MAG: 16S rRNA (uracil(1498)-N(3))-methyltransferase [Bacteroidetes bacterium GWF2_35_48]OFY82882.1 MAG: 16S rRNA (uracil(1498)-N(3))-methyltransferase [Bacteroidetes bacterium RIFOXYA12_FULL_35_11]OFY95067.1 MAG: 16S rRNA (uracil(1498)-N(3))-methyltransferase [Bacteroidetes bacterium RIFOXYC12_FULL_35_7]HBX53576.1 16S rRNA (uracil(1498)-N(3))-methyltransferase [Bacteroidales bacterium]